MGFLSDCRLWDDGSQMQPFFALLPPLKTPTLGLTSGRRFKDSRRDTAACRWGRTAISCHCRSMNGHLDR
jgi:hypothetical protein